MHHLLIHHIDHNAVVNSVHNVCLINEFVIFNLNDHSNF